MRRCNAAFSATSFMERKMNEQIAARALVNENEAARILGLSVKTLRRWRWAGKGPVFRKIGGAVRYDLSDLEAFITAARRHSTSDDGSTAAGQAAA